MRNPHPKSRKYMTSLPPDLAALKAEIEGYARGYGLDFYEAIFEVLDWTSSTRSRPTAAFPPAIRTGASAWSTRSSPRATRYGLSKIYEMVINNDPCYAYLLHSNAMVDQKLVMAHVYGHCDFFKNNVYFAHTNRKMMDEMANHGTRVRRYIDAFGEDEVENFIDACLSLDTSSTTTHRRSSAASPPPLQERRPTPARGADACARTEGVHGQVHQSRRSSSTSSARSLEEEAKQRAPLPERPGEGRAAVPARARAARTAGSATCSRSSATRPTTSPRRGRRRS